MSVQSYSEMGERFTLLIDALVAQAEANGKAALNQGPAAHLLLDKNGWDGNLLDPNNLGKPFDRNEHSTCVQRSVASAENSGTEGDLIVSALQGDLLATAERAYRLRHTTPTRARIHAGGRQKALAHASGVYQRGLRGTVAQLLARAKDFNP